MMKLTIHIQDERWKKLLRPYKKTVTEACEAALQTKSRKKYEISVVLASDAFVRQLNRDFRGKDKPTNVLAFPSNIISPPPLWGRVREGGKITASFTPPPQPSPIKGEGDFLLGDIILARQTIEREAKEQGKSPRDHATHLLVHGTLHLLGYNHKHEKEAKIMEALEVKILKKLKINNPYL